jgi:hypothetical protein
MPDGSRAWRFNGETTVQFRDGPIPSSPFFRLHPALRQIVYGFVFALPAVQKIAQRDAGSTLLLSKNFLSLLQTCRSIYWEARLVPFAVNIFTPVPLCWFHALQLLYSLRPWQAQALRGLKLEQEPDDLSNRITYRWLSTDIYWDRYRSGVCSCVVIRGHLPVGPLFSQMVSTMYPIYLHMRDEHNKPYRVIGPIERDSDWEEILKGCDKKTIVLSGSSKLPSNL